MKECQRWVDSIEFSDWIGFWAIEVEQSGAQESREPTTEELTGKIHAWVARHNASVGAKTGK